MLSFETIILCVVLNSLHFFTMFDFVFRMIIWEQENYY